MDELDPDAGFGLTSPLPYVLVTSLDDQGRPNVLGVAWVTKVSFSPFLMLVSIGHNRYSHGLIKNCKEFVICYPSVDQEKNALYCGTHSGRKEDKLARSGLKTIPSKKVKPPTVDGCTVAFECKLVDTHEAGDHTLFIGEVVAATGNPAKAKHLFVTTGTKMVAMDQKGNVGP